VDEKDGGEPWVFAGIHQSELAEYLTDADPTSQVLKGHLAVEAVLGEALDVRMELPAELRRMKLSFARKVSLSVALGILSQDEANAFQALNGIRNSLAHEYHYTISDSDAESLLGALPAWWQESEVVKEQRAGDLGKKLRLGLLVIYTMAGRAVERELDLRRSQKRLADVVTKYGRSIAKDAGAS
jgi:hypothetical protein